MARERAPAAEIFDPGCRRCPRLARYLDGVRAQHPDYHAAPVAPFGARRAGLLIVGLAPGLHGANRSGRPFTGDQAGELLYRSLHRWGFASRPVSAHADDRLRLRGCRITNAVKCCPPGNRPNAEEIRRCNGYLAAELGTLPRKGLVLALGRIAHAAVLRGLALRPAARWPFGHGHEHALDGGRTLIDSYHCSRYNTQTGRLTEAMFDAVLDRVRVLMDSRR